MYTLKQFQRMQTIINDVKIGRFALEVSKKFSLRDLLLAFDVCQKLCHESVVLCCVVQNCTDTQPMRMTTLPTVKLKAFIHNAHNESTIQPHIHSLSQVIFAPSIHGLGFVVCCLTGFRPTGCRLFDTLF